MYQTTRGIFWICLRLFCDFPVIYAVGVTQFKFKKSAANSPQPFKTKYFTTMPWSWFYDNNTNTRKLKKVRKPRKPSFTSRSLSNAVDVKNPAVLLTMVAWLATYGPSLGSGADYLRMVNVEYQKPRRKARRQLREAAAKKRKQKLRRCTWSSCTR